MPSVPHIDAKGKRLDAPHVFILGSGASRAAFPNGDRNGKKVPLMQDLVEIVGLKPILGKYGIVEEITDFESFYDGLVTSREKPDLVTEIERHVHDYFISLQLPDEATVYDYLILSLREKDLIATFNWDPFLAQAYRRNFGVAKLPAIVFPHGNVEVGTCLTHQKKGWLFQKCPECEKLLEPTRLLYPVKQKNYNDDAFIKNEWDILRAFLKHAYFITIFGYSAPLTDVEAKKLMLDEWRNNQINWLAQIEIVDIKPREQLEASWKDFLITREFRRNYSIGYDLLETQAFRYARRSCDALAMATLQQEAFSENHFPVTTDLRELQRWVKPLVQEEAEGHFSGKRTHPSTH